MAFCCGCRYECSCAELDELVGVVVCCGCRYECSCAELDELVGVAKASGALGARLTGGYLVTVAPRLHSGSIQRTNASS